MKQLLIAYRFVNLLSIDIAAGSVIGAAFFARIVGVTLFPQAYIVLALTVWIIYTTDHLLDARRLQQPASTDRHRLHQRYFTILAMLVMVAMVVAVVLVFFIRTQLMIPGLIMASLCAFYLLLNRWMKYLKEVMATILYAGGVLLPALSINNQLTTGQWMLVVQFVLLVLINMLLFAQMDYGTDLRDRQQSFVTAAGLRITNTLIGCLFAAFGLTLLISISAEYVEEEIVLSIMASVLLLIYLFPKFFKLEERYRLAGDAVFLLPVVLLSLS